MKRRVTINLKVNQARCLHGHLTDTFSTSPARELARVTARRKLELQLKRADEPEKFAPK